MNRVNSEVSLQENPPHSAHSDIMPMWGRPHKDGLDHGQGFQYSAHNFELMKPQGGLSGYWKWRVRSGGHGPGKHKLMD